VPASASNGSERTGRRIAWSGRVFPAFVLLRYGNVNANVSILAEEALERLAVAVAGEGAEPEARRRNTAEADGFGRCRSLDNPADKDRLIEETPLLARRDPVNPA